MSHYVVGLTGGIGSGKTAVSDRFFQLGIDVVDADVVAREVVAQGSPALEKISTYFGQQAITENGDMDRAYIRQKVFANEKDKQWLNALLHPLIREMMLAQIEASTSAYCILAVPLLIENHMTPMVDRVLVVDIEESLQVSRAGDRDGQNAQQIKRIIASQASRQTRLAAANDVINNNQDLSALQPQIEILHRNYLALAIAKNA